MSTTKRGRLYGVIHIGSVALSLCIAEYTDSRHVTVVQQARRAADFGEEVFATGALSFTSIRRMCRYLNGFRRILADYQVSEVVVYATAVLREADNRRMILDLIRVHTTLDVQVVDMPQEIYFKHFALHHRLTHPYGQGRQPIEGGVLFVDITSSSVGFTAWEDDRLTYQQNVHIGTLRLLERFDRRQRDAQSYPQAVSEYLRHMLAPIWPMLERCDIRSVVLSGRESRMVARLMGVRSNHDMMMLSPENFARVFAEVGDKTATGLMHYDDMTEPQAEALLPTLHLYAEVLAHVPAERLVMMGITFLYGAVFYHGALVTGAAELEYLRDQHLELARSIASRYGGNLAHLDAVEQYTVVLMDALRTIHGMTLRDRYLVRMAALLHTVGKYVNLRQNNEHTYHIIMGTDIFGLSDLEKEVVATIAYYNYKGTPSDEDAVFRRLPEAVKMTVIKLAAVLRMAIALDQGETQKLRRVEAALSRGELVIAYTSQRDTTLEMWTCEEENRFFADVFGVNVRLERRRDR